FSRRAHSTLGQDPRVFRRETHYFFIPCARSTVINWGNFISQMFNEAFNKKYGYQPEWGAENGYVSFVHWVRMVEETGSFYPPDIIKTWEKGEKIPSLLGDVHYRPEDHQCVRPVIIVKGKKPADMKNKEDFSDLVEIVPGDGLMQKPDAFGCKLGDYT
ncbi:MAG: ABC transporter substrate-binding protein, partial [Rhizobiales bacterium]|nr:ABC transporter substrate-binding protein [Hyphomicrobiales bacterium]